MLLTTVSLLIAGMACDSLLDTQILSLHEPLTCFCLRY